MNVFFSQQARAIAALAALLSVAATAQAGHPLNDTGVRQCIDASGTFSNKCAGTGQDGETGRDVTHKSSQDGRLGFAFQRVCNSGEMAGTGSCPAVPVLGKRPNEWGCTRDKTTNLIWEVKTDDGLRGYQNTYILWGDWYNNTEDFVAAVNSRTLCGASDWRLPTLVELQSIVDYGLGATGLAIDENWFYKTKADYYWTSETMTDLYRKFEGNLSYVVDFGTGDIGLSYPYRHDKLVRLVRKNK